MIQLAILLIMSISKLKKVIFKLKWHLILVSLVKIKKLIIIVTFGFQYYYALVNPFFGKKCIWELSFWHKNLDLI